VGTLKKQQTNPRPSSVNCSKLDQRAGALPAHMVLLPGIWLFSLSWQGGGAWGDLGNYFKIPRDFRVSATGL